MVSTWSAARSRGVAGRLWSALRMVGLAAALGLALSVVSLFPAGGAGASRVAYACGLVTAQTMLANGTPAIVYPIPPNTNVPADQPIGIFALQYVAGQQVTFAEDVSRAQGIPSLSSIPLRWTFGDGASSNTLSPNHAYAHAGTFNVHLQTYNSFTNTWDDIDSAQIQVIGAALPNPPIARATATATAVVANKDTITFDATGSRALVGTHLTYLWNFNDASTATGPHVTHQFGLTGSSFVVLIVTDDRGARSLATINIGVVSDPQQIPTASLSASTTSPQVGQQATFDASQSAPASEPAGDQLVKYAWDFGDGSPAQTTQTPKNSHAFQKPGSYTVAVQAIDQQGTPAQATLAVTVSAAASTGGGASGPNWLVWGGGLLVLLLLVVGGYFFVQSQREQALLERRRLAAQELRRARRVPTGGVRPGDPRWGDPRADNRGVSRGGAARQPTGARDPRRGPPSGGR